MVIVYLITEIGCLIAAILSFAVNLFIIVAFLKKKVASTDNLRLALYLAIGDFGYAISALVHIGCLVVNWSNYFLDYNPYIIIITNSFLPAHLKIIVVISCAMALDRCLAIFYPLFYRKLKKVTFANLAMIIGMLWFLFDFIFQIITAPYERRPNCATMACFVNKKFLKYISLSNTIFGLMTVSLSIIVFAGLCHISKRRLETRTTAKQNNVFRQANRITVGILFSCWFFVTIPSLLVTGYEEMMGISLFEKLGPFYIFVILLNGLADGLVFVMVNRKQLMARKTSSFTKQNTVIPAHQSSHPSALTGSLNPPRGN